MQKGKSPILFELRNVALWEWAGMVGAVGKISAFQPQGPQFYPGSAEI